MILGIAQKELAADNSVLNHLNSCTGCGACEVMCPSRVPFMQLLDNTKLIASPRQSLTLKTLLFLSSHPGRYALLKKALGNQVLGKLLRSFKLLNKHTASLQKVIKHSTPGIDLSSVNPAKGKARGDIGLFTGCITSLFDRQTLADTITLLTHCGFNVHLPQGQACCGALHQHNAQIDVAQKLSQQNQQIFQRKTLNAVISTSTGCTTQLSTQLNNIAIFDIMQFISDQQLLDNLALAPLKASIAVHEPCSQRNQLKLSSIGPLLENIPEANIINLDNNHQCCGAGGANLIMQNDSSIQLKQLKTDAISRQNPDILVTTNYGCALHIASGLQENLSQDKQIEILHPVSLLVRSASLQ